MPRFTDEQIKRLKRDISLIPLIEQHGISLKPHGKDFIGLCPFHEDKSPSLVISPTNNLWHCLGACSSGGSVIDWVMQIEGISFRHAVELLLSDYQPLAANKRPVKKASTCKLAIPFKSDIEDQQLLNQVIDYYHQSLLQNPESLNYLKQRGITNSKVIKTFKLGVSNRTLGYRLPAKNRKQGAIIRQQLQKIGIYRTTGHEHFSGSLIIPVIDEQDNVVEVYGRKLRDDLRKGTPKHLYLPGPHQGIFNIASLKASKELILCESLIDALSFWCNGYRNVTSSYGIEGFTKEHLARFKQYEIESVLIAYDRDDAGNQAADKLAKQLMHEGIDCYRILFPKGMDVNSYALQVTPAAKSLGVVIRSAEWLGAGKKKPLSTDTITTEPINNDEASYPDLEPVNQAEPAEPADHQALPASPLPDIPQQQTTAEVNNKDITITIDERRYRIRGLNKNSSYEQLKINLLISQQQHIHIDTLDLYQSRPRSTFIKQAAIELGISEETIKSDLGKLLLKLEAIQEAKIKQTKAKPAITPLTEKEQKEALTLLQSKNLLTQIQQDFTHCGIIGEGSNSLLCYLAAVSRKLSHPLAILIQSSSAAGKSALMDTVLQFIPKEDQHQYSAMTGQSLYYLGETNLKHTILAITEQQGAIQAAYALKLLQSEGQLTIASTTKDPDSGELITKEYKVQGPVMLFLTTTAIDIDEELLNRCIVLTVNEDRTQTEAIHQLQRQKRTLQGLIQKTQRASILKQHQNAQRLLKPLSVVNPYAEQLTFLNEQTRTRRDHEKYLTLIDSIALLHQYQRTRKTITHHNQTIEYIEVTIDDIEKANDLAHEVLGRSLDELPPQTRKLLSLINKMVAEQCQQQQIAQKHYHFSRRDIRAYTGWGNTQCRVHIARLVEMEYLLPLSGRRGQRYLYELTYDGKNKQQQNHLNGLIDVEQLKNNVTMPSLRGNKDRLAGLKRPQNGGMSVLKRSTQTSQKADNHEGLSATDEGFTETAYIRGNEKYASYS